MRQPSINVGVYIYIYILVLPKTITAMVTLKNFPA